MEFNKVLDTFSNHSTTIINYFEERLTNASAESFNAKIKGTPLRGVVDLKFFMFRLARLGTFIKYYKISQLIHTQIIAN